MLPFASRLDKDADWFVAWCSGLKKLGALQPSHRTLGPNPGCGVYWPLIEHFGLPWQLHCYSAGDKLVCENRSEGLPATVRRLTGLPCTPEFLIPLQPWNSGKFAAALKDPVPVRQLMACVDLELYPAMTGPLAARLLEASSFYRHSISYADVQGRG